MNNYETIRINDNPESRLRNLLEEVKELRIDIAKDEEFINEPSDIENNSSEVSNVEFTLGAKKDKLLAKLSELKKIIEEKPEDIIKSIDEEIASISAKKEAA